MALYKYRAKDKAASCAYCKDGFKVFRNMSAKPLQTCRSQ